jgi:hypothetical protein
VRLGGVGQRQAGATVRIRVFGGGGVAQRGVTPDNYKVLFVQGASTQFAAIPLNFTKEGERVFIHCV